MKFFTFKTSIVLSLLVHYIETSLLVRSVKSVNDFVETWVSRTCEYSCSLDKIRLCITDDEWKIIILKCFQPFLELTLTNIRDLIHKKYMKIDYHTCDFIDQEPE